MARITARVTDRRKDWAEKVRIRLWLAAGAYWAVSGGCCGWNGPAFL